MTGTGGVFATSGSSRGAGTRLVGALVVCLAFLCGASSAWAGASISVTPSFPTLAFVGQTGLVARISMVNTSTGAEATQNMVLSAITLVPSCGALTFGDCPAANVDPGVFSLGATGQGEAGTACGGVTFSLSTIDASQGKQALDPVNPVVLGPTGSGTAGCTIDLRINVLRQPAKDSDPQAGLQTADLAAATGQSTDGAGSRGFGSGETTVNRGNPTIATQVASPAATVGATISDTATLTPAASSPAPTGTVTFNVYGPSDSTCITPIATSTSRISGATATSTAFQPTTSGIYRYVATYNGDAANNPRSTACNDPGEAVLVKGQPTIATHVAASSVAVGDPISDTATVSPGAGAPAPTGSVNFNVYGPGDTGCTNPLERVASQLSGNTATSAPPTFTATTSGTYQFVAVYNGDASNNQASGHCNDPNETVTVGPDEAPTASYNPSTYTPAAGQAMSFDATASRDPDGTITSYRWAWNDGTPDGSGPTPTHTFANAGTRGVYVYITDSAGKTAAAGHTITVGDELPTATYTPSTYHPVAGQTVSFNATASRDPDGTITSYRWVWNDGTPDGSGPTPTHVFTVSGVHPVFVYVTDSDARTAAAGHTITVGG